LQQVQTLGSSVRTGVGYGIDEHVDVERYRAQGVPDFVRHLRGKPSDDGKLLGSRKTNARGLDLAIKLLSARP
jgi:hypothetical protein